MVGGNHTKTVSWVFCRVKALALVIPLYFVFFSNAVNSSGEASDKVQLRLTWNSVSGLAPKVSAALGKPLLRCSHLQLSLPSFAAVVLKFHFMKTFPPKPRGKCDLTASCSLL